jgi:hypothetical protein
MTDMKKVKKKNLRLLTEETSNLQITDSAHEALDRICVALGRPKAIVIHRIAHWLVGKPPALLDLMTGGNWHGTEAQLLRKVADALDPPPTGMGRVPADVANNDPTPQPSPNSKPESA